MRLIECCAGTAQVTFRLVTGKAGLCSMVGSKRWQASWILEKMGLEGVPNGGVLLVDAGPWGKFFEWGLVEGMPQKISDWLIQMNGGSLTPVKDGSDRVLYDRIRSRPPASDPAQWCAEFLFLQARTYRGKPVLEKEDGWVTHGLDPEYRLSKTSTSPNSNPRGFNNARPRLAEKVRGLDALIDAGVIGKWSPIQEVQFKPGDFVYFDPPYGPFQGYAELLSALEVQREGDRALREGSAWVGISHDTPDSFSGWIPNKAPERRRRGGLKSQGSGARKNRGTTEYLMVSHR